MPSRRGMRSAKALMELEALAEKLGIQVIHEGLCQSRSGLCRLYDQYMLFVERNLTAAEQVQVFTAALSRFPLDNIQILPWIRQLLEKYGKKENTDALGEKESEY